MSMGEGRGESEGRTRQGGREALARIDFPGKIMQKKKRQDNVHIAKYILHFFF